jgi:hypothetical protein
MHLALSNTHNTGNELGSEIICIMYQARDVYAVRIKIYNVRTSTVVHDCIYNVCSLLSRAVKVSAGIPSGVLSLARRQYCADSYVAQNHSTASQLHT